MQRTKREGRGLEREREKEREMEEEAVRKFLSESSDSFSKSFADSRLAHRYWPIISSEAPQTS